uniref:Immunoglobulin domain-containing protein n=1 Tax=Chrysemys picta bellii TaxID=8478 RepID=A0A8C3FRF1_CHRPI
MWFVSPPLTACLFVNPERSLPKPSISVSPGGVIPMGGNITIRCWHQHLGMRFHLYKAGVGNSLTYTDPAGSEAEFPITSARREHGGSYTCRYSNRTGGAAFSEPSDPVQIIVAGEGPSQHLVAVPGSVSRPVSSHCRAQLPQTLRLPQPQRGVTLGGAVTVQCRGQRRGLEFVLDKAGARNTAALGGDSAGVKFPIPKASRADGGSNTCYHPPDSDPDQARGPSSPGDARPGNGDGVTAGFPSQEGAAAPGDSGQGGYLKAAPCA